MYRYDRSLKKIRVIKLPGKDSWTNRTIFINLCYYVIVTAVFFNPVTSII